MENRKPLIVLAALAVLAIVLFVVGVVGVARGDEAAGGLPTWAGPDASPGDPLTTDDLSGDSSCPLDGTVIAFSGDCEMTVREVTGGWPWQSATRRARLVVAQGPVGLAVTLAGKAMSADLDEGDDIRLTYTREGGSFMLVCGNPTGCVVTLAKDS